MKITCERTTLFKAAAIAAKAAASGANQSIPELSGLLLEADTGNFLLTITGNNNETCVQTRLREVSIEEAGGAVIDASLLCGMLKLMGGETVTIETDEHLTAYISSGNTHYTVKALPPEKFPKPIIPFPADTVKVTGLPRLIAQTLFAAGKDRNNPKLQGVRLTFSAAAAKAAATDSYRLAVARTAHCADGNLEVILHQRSLHVLNSIIGTKEEMYMGVSGKSAVLMGENLVFCARLLEGPFIDVDGMLGSVTKACGCVCGAKELYHAADGVYAMSKYNTGQYIHLTIEPDGVRFDTSGELGNAAKFVGAKEITPTPADGFYYTPGLLLDFLRLASGDVTVTVSDKGFLLLSADGTTYLMTPRRAPKPKAEEEERPVKQSKTKKRAAKAA